MKKYFWLALSVVSAFMVVYSAVLAFSADVTTADRWFYGILAVVWVWDAYITYDIYRTAKATERIRARIEQELSVWGESYFADETQDDLTK